MSLQHNLKKSRPWTLTRIQSTNDSWQTIGQVVQNQNVPDAENQEAENAGMLSGSGSICEEKQS